MQSVYKKGLQRAGSLKENYKCKVPRSFRQRTAVTAGFGTFAYGTEIQPVCPSKWKTLRTKVIRASQSVASPVDCNARPACLAGSPTQTSISNDDFLEAFQGFPRVQRWFQ